MKKTVFLTLSLLAFAVMLLSSCKKDEQVPTKQKSKGDFIAVDSDPYTGPEIVGGAEYMLVESKINADNTVTYYHIYTNRADGKPYSDSKRVYYNPTPQTTTIQFGENVKANTADFVRSVNSTLNGDVKWAILSFFHDGGPANYSYKLYDAETLVYSY